MEKDFFVKETWLSRDPSPSAFTVTWFMTLFVVVSSLIFFGNNFGAEEWMPASAQAVFNQHQYWKAWTALFAHADTGHLLGNCLMFVPLAYFLSGHYGALLFPLMGIAVGGLTNLVVLKTMPLQTSLIGISGVVYWMGAAWLTLYLLIERRDSLRRRLGKSLLISAVLFLPETYKGEISYLSHFVGFIFGVVSAAIFYVVQREKFRQAEVLEKYPDEEGPFIWMHSQNAWESDTQLSKPLSVAVLEHPNLPRPSATPEHWVH